MELDKVILKKDLIKDVEKIASLYESVGWNTYTDNIKLLEKAFINSLKVISAWHDDKLVGLIRVVGDGVSIIYIQDLLVLPEYQGNGIGKGLIKSILDEFVLVPQKVLISDNEEVSLEFYKNLGFKSIENYDGVAFVNYIE
ncbi:GNAT family N-acetyltransferase [Clostridium sp. B9]|uniref:GNAT family N-acetyltransferase n=1 Tax=Clostridium sp. B9 TaxID=3423224 RepID=UPI003D2F3CFC